MAVHYKEHEGLPSSVILQMGWLPLLSGVAQIMPLLLVSAVVSIVTLWWCCSYGYISFRDGWPMLSLKPLKLPPGTMGWPFVGETLDLLKDPNGFLNERARRYGEMYKTHLIGWPTVVTTSAEAFKFVMVTKSEELKPLYPKPIAFVLGPNYVNFLSGDLHAQTRKLHLRHLLPGALKDMVAGVEELALMTLNSWAPESMLPSFVHEVQQFTLGVGMFIVFGLECRTPEVQELAAFYSEMERGFTSVLTINLPGFQWRKTLQARRVVVSKINELARRRRAKSEMAKVSARSDLLDSFLRVADSSLEDPLSDGVLADNVVGLLFASNSTTAATLSWILKFLHDNPPLLAAVKAEQDSIRERKGADEPLTWDDLKDMELSPKVMQEALRLAHVISDVIVREAVVDVKFKGFVIPRGWRVRPLLTHVHMDPNLWPDPNKFDPSRFEAPQRGTVYAPFGAGEHQCVGNELARVEVLVFLHHLVTKFRWQVLEDGPIMKLPFNSPYKGLPLKIKRIE